jgi:hypothetical protein
MLSRDTLPVHFRTGAFAMRIPFLPRTISAALFYAFVTDQMAARADDDVVAQKTLLLTSDLYIKARSYAWINKSAFWASLVLSILTVTWPALSLLSTQGSWAQPFLTSSVVQASVTALAALSIGFYTHYKARQMIMENLMRRLIFGKPEEWETLVPSVVQEIEKADQGFSFGQIMQGRTG